MESPVGQARVPELEKQLQILFLDLLEVVADKIERAVGRLTGRQHGQHRVDGASLALVLLLALAAAMRLQPGMERIEGLIARLEQLLRDLLGECESPASGRLGLQPEEPLGAALEGVPHQARLPAAGRAGYPDDTVVQMVFEQALELGPLRGRDLAPEQTGVAPGRGRDQPPRGPDEGHLLAGGPPIAVAALQVPGHLERLGSPGREIGLVGSQVGRPLGDVAGYVVMDSQHLAPAQQNLGRREQDAWAIHGALDGCERLLRPVETGVENRRISRFGHDRECAVVDLYGVAVVENRLPHLLADRGVRPPDPEYRGGAAQVHGSGV